MKSDAEKAQRIGDVSLRLGNGIKRVEHLLMGEKARALRDFELTVPQYATLATLAQSPGQSALVSPQTMATILSNLEAKGLIARDVSSLHTRVLVCRLTESGEGLVSKADESVRAIEDDLRSAFTDDEFSQFHEYLARSEKRILARKIS